MREEISVIKYKESELKFILFGRDNDIAIPFHWLLELMSEVYKRFFSKKKYN